MPDFSFNLYNSLENIMKGSISIAYLILARQLNCFIAMFWRLLYNVSDMYVSISQFIGDSLISSNCIRH